MQFEFAGELWFWRGPAPWHFVTVPETESSEIGEAAAAVTYGWGMVPVTAQVGRTTWTTSLWPKGGCYVLPVKSLVRRAEALELGALVAARIDLQIQREI